MCTEATVLSRVVFPPLFASVAGVGASIGVFALLFRSVLMEKDHPAER